MNDEYAATKHERAAEGFLSPPFGQGGKIDPERAQAHATLALMAEVRKLRLLLDNRGS